MAVAVLERKVETEEKNEYNVNRDVFMTADERHNSQISANYARLIHSDNPVKFIRGEADTESAEKTAEVAPEKEEQVYRVNNARADSDLFRAESAVNKNVIEMTEAEDEENEDLRPTQTTIQYKTSDVRTLVEEGKIETKPQVKRSALTKKDKIIVAVAFTVIVALFILIIVNSAIISGLNSEVSALKATLNETESEYTQVLNEKQTYLEEENLLQVVNDFAAENGMVRR